MILFGPKYFNEDEPTPLMVALSNSAVEGSMGTLTTYSYALLYDFSPPLNGTIPSNLMLCTCYDSLI